MFLPTLFLPTVQFCFPAFSRYAGTVFTLFTIPKAFKGHIGVIQRNAIGSWAQLARGSEGRGEPRPCD